MVAMTLHGGHHAEHYAEPDEPGEQRPVSGAVLFLIRGVQRVTATRHGSASLSV